MRGRVLSGTFEEETLERSVGATCGEGGVLALHDLTSAAAEIARLAEGVRDEQLGAETPCAEWSVAVLLSHLLGLSVAFTAVAEKKTVPDNVAPGNELPVGWRNMLAERTENLAHAWRSSGAWEGDREFLGAVTSAESLGIVTLDELVLHGWDLARATGQRFHAAPEDIQTCLGFAAAMSEPGVEREGLYGPVVPVPENGSDFDRLLCLAGRNPKWSTA